MESRLTTIRARSENALLGVSIAAPAALTAWLSLDNGGNRPGTAGIAAVLLGLLLMLRLLLAPSTVYRPSGLTLGALAALALYVLLALTSALWSHAEDRAVADFCRGMLYVLLLATMVTLPPFTVRWVVRAAALVLTVIGLIALLSRLAPGLVITRPSPADTRLSVPIGYWNAVALMLATAFVLNLHLASDDEEPLVVRSIATSMLPPMAVALYLTQSRGGLGVAAIGAAVYLAVGRPSGARAVCFAAAGPLLLVAVASFQAQGLIDGAWRSAQRQALLLLGVTFMAAAAAGFLRILLIDAADRVPRLRRPRAPRGRLRAIVGAVLAVLALAAVVAPAGGQRLYHAFEGRGPADGWTNPRSRLASPYSNGRADLWRAALHDAPDHALLGTGAGTFSYQWNRLRPSQSEAVDAHSLYVEALGELGVIGFGLLIVGLAGLAIAVLRGRRLARPLHAAAFAVLLVWALDAAVEWVWEIPAVTVTALGLAGAAAATSGRRWRPGAVARASLAVLTASALLVPAAQAVSQREMTRAKRAYNLNRCTNAEPTARRAGAIAPWRAEPDTLLALCAARRGDRTAALARIESATKRDPGDWRLAIDRALIEASTGGDPRLAFHDAAVRNQVDGIVRYLFSATVALPRTEWPSVFRRAFPYVDGFVEMPIGPGAICSGYSVGYWRWTTWTQERCAPTTGPGPRISTITDGASWKP
jgi:hypothetical protein